MNVAFVSFRFSPSDGVSVETAKWRAVLAGMGVQSYTVAGAGEADHLLPGLSIGATEPPAKEDVADALQSADVVVVENLCSLPLNRQAADVVAGVLRGRPAVLHHHDLPWQRHQTAHVDDFPPDDPAWRHVTINFLSRQQLAERGITAVAVPNCFDTEAPPGDRAAARETLGIAGTERVLLHPTRAIPRKNVPAAIALAAGINATYWLLGPPEDGYGAELDRLVASAPVRVLRGMPEGISVAGAYAAADAVALPSAWEGFGNATIESAVHRRPIALSCYPVAREIAAFGFRWFPAGDARPLARWLEHPQPHLIETNHAIARRHFSLESLRRRLETVFGL